MTGICYPTTRLWNLHRRGQRTVPSGNYLQSLMHLAQRAGQVWEVAGAQRLHAGIVLTIEWRDRARASSGDCILRRVEPQAQVVHLHGIERRIHACIREGPVESLGPRARR